MKENERKLRTSYLIADMALMMMKITEPKGALKVHVDKVQSEIVTKYGKDAFKRLLVCKNVLAAVAAKLAACESEEEVIKTLRYVDAINTADIYIAAEGQEIIQE